MENFDMLYESHKKWVDTAGESGHQINLDGTDMHSIPLNAPLLEQGFFSECDFSGLSFDNVDFYQSEFYSCNFTEAHFTNCDFRKTTLDYCVFQGATFSNCKFSRADAFNAQFNNCRFMGCSFVGFNLMESSIIGTVIETTDFDEAYFDKINAQNAVITNPLNADMVNHISIYLESPDHILEGKDAFIALAKQN